MSDFMSQASAYLLNPKYSFELTYCLYIKNILPCCLLRNLSKISFFCCSRGWSCCLSQEVRTPCLSESECKGTTFFRTDKLFAIFFYDFLNFSFPHPVLAPSLIIYIYAREGNGTFWSERAISHWPLAFGFFGVNKSTSYF